MLGLFFRKIQFFLGELEDDDDDEAIEFPPEEELDEDLNNDFEISNTKVKLDVAEGFLEDRATVNEEVSRKYI